MDKAFIEAEKLIKMLPGGSVSQKGLRDLFSKKGIENPKKTIKQLVKKGRIVQSGYIRIQNSLMKLYRLPEDSVDGGFETG